MRGVVVDTSVWVSHFRDSNETLVRLLESDRVLIHPWIIGEIACGTPPERSKTLQDLQWLQTTQQAQFSEVLHFVEHHQLYGLGCGWVDLTLLCSTMMTPSASLWTLDRRLGALCARMGCAFDPMHH